MVGDVFPLNFPDMKDPDPGDIPSLASIDFGSAQSFISGDYPSYVINPIDNSTNPGSYLVNVKITDDNPSPMTTSYTFRIVVDPQPMPAATPANSTANTTSNISESNSTANESGAANNTGGSKQTNNRNKMNNKLQPVKDLAVRIKSITASGLVTVSFNQAINVPGNFTNIDESVLRISVKPGPDTKKEFIRITSWSITSNYFCMKKQIGF